MWWLIKVAFVLWGAGLLGMDRVLKNPDRDKLAEWSDSSWVGSNLPLIALAMFGVAIWASMPPGLTWKEKLEWVVQQFLARVKGVTSWIGVQWGKAA